MFRASYAPIPRLFLSHRLSQRLDCSGRFSFRKPLLYGWHRNPQHQPLCHSGCIRRTGKYCQCRPDTRDYILYGRLPRQPLRSLEFRPRLPPQGRKSGQAGVQSTIGASEVSLSGAGHLGQRTTYLFSARQSYLQLLFKALGLPFLPNFIDGQFKTKTRFNEHSELTLLGLAGIDKMKLNTDEKGEEPKYLLSYLPTIHQETFTLGASYRHYNGSTYNPLY